MNPDDLCPRPEFLETFATQPMAPAIYPAAVYRCQSPEQARKLLAGEVHGYIYSRDGHPNGDALAEKCRELHQADRAIACGSGMSALTAAILSQVQGGEHVVVSRHLYGRSLQLLGGEMQRYGIASTLVNASNLQEVAGACNGRTRMIVVETISNPLARVADLGGLAKIAHDCGAQLLVDNSFAGPTVCRPLELGADLVMESLTKIINGHSDVLLGLLCGREGVWQRVPEVVSVWGLSANPFDCWLTCRGLGTLALRAARAGENANEVARFLAERNDVEAVHFPGLAEHPDHALASRQFHGGFGTIVTFTLPGGIEAASRFIAAVSDRIPFSPSLGDLSTTLSHPQSTSHRGLSEEERNDLGIFGGTIRLSVGIESPAGILEALGGGLQSLSDRS